PPDPRRLPRRLDAPNTPGDVQKLRRGSPLPGGRILTKSGWAILTGFRTELLRRMEIEVDQLLGLVLCRLPAPFLNGLNCCLAQKRTPANHMGGLNVSTGSDDRLHLHCPANLHSACQVRIDRLYFGQNLS